MKDMYLFVKNYAGFAKGAKVKHLEKPLADDLKRNAVIEDVAEEKAADAEPQKETKKSKKK